MHAPETPEAYFSDYGESKLVNGRAHIDLDPIFAKNVRINEKHPLRVYIQVEGDCGVYVTNKTETGFDVIELYGGVSNTPFQWNVICNMRDAIMPSGELSKFEDLRFEPAPKPEKEISAEKKILDERGTAPEDKKGDPKFNLHQKKVISTTIEKKGK